MPWTVQHNFELLSSNFYLQLRTSSLPKSARKKDFLRPLWVLGMLLYILSQLIGSTLALEYMRAEYVAPLGSTSLVFNFMFASLIGTPVTKWDIYGTVVVVAGVIGIVAFGSVNSGLHPDTDLDRLKTMWSRPGWLLYFVLMALGIIIVYIGTSQLDAIWVARGDLQALPTSRTAPPPVKADAGVVLLTHKKPEPKPAANPTGAGDDDHSMRTFTSPSKSQKAGPRVLGDDQSNWSIGAESESEAEGDGQGPSTPKKRSNTLTVSPAAARRSPVQSLRESVRGVARRVSEASSIGLGLQIQKHTGEEGRGLMGGNDDDDEESPASASGLAERERFVLEFRKFGTD
ncbi:hypothetical protein FRC00_002909 [Tulasnella sp. 408]|nr:hypothetical protein FRC00_002909 [Tulasnella sp. 408]